MREHTKICSLALGALLALAGGCGDDDGDDDDVASDAGFDAASDASSAADGGLDAAPDATLGDATTDASPTLQQLTLRFRAKIGQQDLVCGQEYAGQGATGVTATPQDFRFFVQDVRLITRSGSEVPLQLDEVPSFQTKDVALLDFTTGEGACTSGYPTTNMVIPGKIPPGDYSGIVFTVGVPEALNHGNPVTAPAPLQAPGAQWSWLAGYRFLMAELLQVQRHQMDGGMPDAGAHDAGSGGHGGAPGLGFVHLGSAGCSGTEATGYVCTRPNRAVVRLNGFNPSTSEIVADLGAIFAQADLGTSSQCHGVDPDKCAAMFLALGVDLNSGTPLPNQQVFRLE